MISERVTREEPKGIDALMRSDSDEGKTLRRILADQALGKPITSSERLYLATVNLWDQEQRTQTHTIDGSYQIEEQA